MKRSSTTPLALCILWVILAMLWYFKLQNRVVGTLLLAVAVAELVIYVIQRAREKRYYATADEELPAEEEEPKEA